jgi:hypothetical protein
MIESMFSRNDIAVLGIVAIALSGCAGSSNTVTVPISGGGQVSLQKGGSLFKQAENGRVVVTEAGLQAVNFDGKYYVRWTFGVRSKQPTELSSIRIEDVSDGTPVQLVNDVAPQQDAGKWAGNAGLMELSATSLPWFYESNDTVRTLRVTVTEVSGQSYVLYQGVLYTPSAKAAIRNTVGQ